MARAMRMLRILKDCPLEVAVCPGELSAGRWLCRAGLIPRLAQAWVNESSSREVRDWLVMRAAVGGDKPSGPPWFNPAVSNDLPASRSARSAKRPRHHRRCIASVLSHEVTDLDVVIGDFENYARVDGRLR